MLANSGMLDVDGFDGMSNQTGGTLLRKDIIDVGGGAREETICSRCYSAPTPQD